jgi:predicted neuraminidase
MLTRSTGGVICRADSSDGGATWTRLAPSSLPNNNSGIDLVRLESGVLVLLFNPVAGLRGARSPLRLAVSFDNGLSWPWFLDLEAGQGEYSYPAVVARGDQVFASYTWRRERIAFFAASLEQILRAAKPSPESQGIRGARRHGSPTPASG